MREPLRVRYPDISDGTFYVENGPRSYRELIDGFDYDVLADGHDHDYQGDSFYLLRDGERFGFLNFGWGSCSGCDAFEACSTVRDMEELEQSLHRGIRWFDSVAEFMRFLLDDEHHRTQYYWGEDSTYRNDFSDFRMDVFSKLFAVEETP